MDSTNDAENASQPNMIIIHLENNRKPESLSDEYVAGSRKKYPWSAEEKDALLKGVKVHGEGRWQLILESSDAFCASRSAVDLKDKYRLLNRLSSYYKLNKRHWFEVLEDNTLKNDTLGKPQTVFTRFPHDAAKAFSSARNKDGHSSLIVRVAGKEEDAKSGQKVHVYKALLSGNTWRVVKQNVVYVKNILFTGN